MRASVLCSEKCNKSDKSLQNMIAGDGKCIRYSSFKQKINIIFCDLPKSILKYVNTAKALLYSYGRMTGNVELFASTTYTTFNLWFTVYR